MKLIQFNINLTVTKMTCLGPYEMLNFFLTLCFTVTKFCILACLIIWMHTKNIYSYSSLMKIFPLRNIVLCI